MKQHDHKDLPVIGDVVHLPNGEAVYIDRMESWEFTDTEGNVHTYGSGASVRDDDCPTCHQTLYNNCQCPQPVEGFNPTLKDIIMALKPFCKKDKTHEEFRAEASVEQCWLVDRNGDVIEVTDDEVCILTEPNDNEESWQCAVCDSWVEWLDPEGDALTAMAEAVSGPDG